MFSVIPAGRACLTDFKAVSATQFAISFPSTPVFSHLVVFLIPGNILSPDTGAGVYIKLPGKCEFQFLGAIGNEKPSAIFKIKLPISDQTSINKGVEDVMDDGNLAPISAMRQGELMPEIELGISVEPVQNIQAQISAIKFQEGAGADPALTVIHRKQPSSTKELAQKIIGNAFNFLAGFAANQGGQEVVPLKSFEEWWAKFQRRLENDPEFLQNDSI